MFTMVVLELLEEAEVGWYQYLLGYQILLLRYRVLLLGYRDSLPVDYNDSWLPWLIQSVTIHSSVALGTVYTPTYGIHGRAHLYG